MIWIMNMAVNKTTETEASVEEFLNSVANEKKRKDCNTILNCLYIKTLDDIDMNVLTQLVTE